MIQALAAYIVAFFRDPDVIKSTVIGGLIVGGSLLAAVGLRWQP